MTPAEMGLAAVVAVMGGGNLWNWLASRGKTRVDLIGLAHTISGEIISELRDEREQMVREIAELKRTVEDLREEVSLWTAHVTNLEDTIRKAGGTPLARPRRKARE